VPELRFVFASVLKHREWQRVDSLSPKLCASPACQVFTIGVFLSKADLDVLPVVFLNPTSSLPAIEVAIVMIAHSCTVKGRDSGGTVDLLRLRLKQVEVNPTKADAQMEKSPTRET